MAKKNQEFFVNLQDPISFRKSILETSRESIHLLQNYEKLKQIRKDKLQLMHDLNSTMKELFTLSQRLKLQLPKVSPKKSKPVKKEEPVKKLAPKKLNPPKAKSALEKLQLELEEVENQLKELS